MAEAVKKARKFDKEVDKIMLQRYGKKDYSKGVKASRVAARKAAAEARKAAASARLITSKVRRERYIPLTRPSKARKRYMSSTPSTKEGMGRIAAASRLRIKEAREMSQLRVLEQKKMLAAQLAAQKKFLLWKAQHSRKLRRVK